MGFPEGIAGEVVEGGDERLALLWAHGLTSSRAAEDAAAMFRWAAPGRLIRWDAPGHGDSAAVQRPEQVAWPALGRLMLSVADSFGVDRFVAGGASQGTATSLWAAVQAPQRVAALLLVIPPTAWQTRAAQGELYREQASLLEDGGTAALAAELERRPLPPLFAPVETQVRAARRDALLAAEPGNLARVFRGVADSDFPDREAIAALDCPALVLAWADDPGHPVSTAEQLAELLPQARLEVAADLATVLGWRTVVADWLREVC